jgi:amino acid adenylation domain-containing protein
VNIQTEGHIKDIYVLSPMQEGILFHCLYEKDSPAYFEQMSYRLVGDLDIALVKRSMKVLFERHDILKTAFVYKNIKRPVQVVLKERKPEFYYEDLREKNMQDPGAYIREFKQKDKQRSFDLTKDVLLRIAILQLNNKNYEVIWSFHHIIIDGWSIGILISEFFEIYNGLYENRALRLSKVNPFRSYIQWLEEQDREKSKNHWRKYLEGYEEKALIPRSKGLKTAEIGYKNEQLSFSLQKDISDKLNHLAVENQVSLNTIIQTLWGVLLAKYNRKQDVIFGAVVSGRPSEIEDVETMVGLFINTIPVRIGYEEKIRFNELVRRVQENAVSCAPHHYYPLAEIQSQSALKQDLIDHIFAFENYPVVQRIEEMMEKTDTNYQRVRIEVTNVEIFEQTNYDFNLVVAPGNQLHLKIYYNTNAFDPFFIERIVGHYKQLIDQVTKNEAIYIHELTILAPEEVAQILYQFNDTAAGYPEEKTIHQLFASQVEKTPYQLAIGGPTLKANQGKEDTQLTYRYLDKYSNQLANDLKESGLRLDAPAALLVRPAVEMVMAILAILKAGGAYLPIDPDYPGDRIQFMLADSRAQVLVKSRTFSKDIVFEKKILYIEDSFRHTSTISNPFVGPGIPLSPPPPGPSNLAYIIYTSGTTGKPKGAMIEHKNVVRLLFNDRYLFDFNSSDVWTMFHSCCFDFSVWEMYGALLYGGKLIVIPKMVARDPGRYLRILKEEKVTVLNQTPSAFYNLIVEELKCRGKELAFRYIIFGGEALKPYKLEKWKEKYPGIKFINMFGITETTVHVTYKEITNREIDLNISNIGKPIPTLCTYVVGCDLELLPTGIAGELCVGGEGVGRGYLNQPELTAVKFIPNPFKPDSTSTNHGERLYRSGDLVRLSDQGEMEYLGRIDQQVQLRGFRVELEEIESQLLKHEKIRETVVLAKEDENGDSYLCAYIVSQGSLTLSVPNLREFLLKNLPDYMVPSFFVFLDHIPLTPNGKIDRKALPQPYGKIDSGEEYIAPVSESEKKLVKIWENILALKKIGIKDDFFNIGGDSIKAIRVLSQINTEFQSNFKIIDIFENSTIERFAAVADSAKRPVLDEDIKQAEKEVNQLKEETMSSSRAPMGVEDVYPMSDVQKGMVYHTNKNPEAAVYHEQFIYQLKYAGFEIETFKKALHLIVGKHPILRTAFNTTDFAEFVQLVYKENKMEVIHYDISDLDSQNQEKFINDYLTTDRQRLFNLSSPPLWRMIVFEIGKEKIIVAWVFHHAILDGWSNASLMTELNNTFLTLKSTPDFVPQNLKHTYKDFIIEQIAEKKKEDTIDFWKKELDNFNRLDFSALKEKDKNPQNIKTKIYDLGTGFLEKLNHAAKQYHSSIKNLCLAAYYFVMSMLSRENDIVVGLVTNNRPVCEDGDKILGCFLNTIPLRLKVPSHLNWTDYIRRVDEKIMELKRFERIPLFEILKIIGEKTQDRNPLFDTLFNFIDFHIFSQVVREEAQNNPHEEEEARGRLSVDSYENTNTLFDFTVNTTFGGFSIILKYSNTLLSDRNVERLLGYLERILARIVNEPGSLVKREELLSVEERQKLLLDFNDTDSDFPKEKTIHRLFEEQVDKTSDYIAVIAQGAESTSPRGTGPVKLRRRQEIREQHITYRQLNINSNQLARVLRAKGVKPDAIVGLLVDRSIEMIVGIIGILKAGGAYLPIEPDYPPERIKYMLADSSTGILLTTGVLKENIPFDQEVVYLEAEKIKETEKTNLDAKCLPHHLAYIIYTSGTTGKPKGTMIQHKNVVRLMFNDKCLFDFNSSDIWTMFHSYCFDFSVWEMYGPLLYGGELVVIPKMVARDPGHYLKILRENKVTVLNQTPSAFYNLVNEELKSPGKDLYIRYVIFGGEALQPLKLKEWKEMYPGVKLINMFGITETTVHVTYKEITDREIALNISNIGKPIPTSSTYVVDQGLELSPLGIAGELCVGGEGVSRGYLNRPGLTRTKFVENTFKPGERLYRSGDLARILENGEMEYLGRIDHQVQVKGFRIELGEIESQLLKHAEIREAAVIAREDEHGNAYLCAYVVSRKELSISQLREYLLKVVPDYMVPLYFVQLEKIPLTPNGKIDRNALPDPEVKISQDDKYAPPENELQAKLAQIWGKVLAVERVGITDKYFDIGGDSIKAIRLLSVINETLNTNLKIVDLFTNETIEKLAVKINQPDTYADKALEEASKEIEELKVKILSNGNLPGIENIEDVYPMSDIEKGMVFHQLKEPERAIYHDQMVHQITYADFNPERFKKALALMVDKHQILRTGFNMGDFEEPVQIVHKKVPLDIEHYDISDMGTHEQEEYIMKFIAKDRITPMDISVPPLWRMRTFGLDKDHIVVLWVCHHAIIDGWSDASFNTELNNIYLRLKSEPEFIPGKLKSSYKEAVGEQIAQKKKKEIIDFWKSGLLDYKRLEFPAPGQTKSRGETGSENIKTYILDLGTPLRDRLNNTAVKYSTSLKHLCFGAYIYMLNMLSYENDIVVGLVTSNRPTCEDGDKILGCFLNTVPVRMKIRTRIRWRDYIRLVDKKLMELSKYDHLSLFEIARCIGEEAQGQNPLFDTLFNFVDFYVYEEFNHEAQRESPRNHYRPKLSITSRTDTNTLFDFSINTTHGGLFVVISYSNLSISDEMVERCCGYFEKTLDKFIHEPESLIVKDQLIPVEEKDKLLYEFNNTGVSYNACTTIPGLFTQQVERVPDGIAVVGPGTGEQKPHKEHLSYRKLHRQSNHLACLLKAKGIKPDTIVGIMAERSIEMVIGILGILKAGGAYLPIDPDYPADRISYMLADSGAKILVTSPILSEKFEKLLIANCQLQMVNEMPPNRQRLNNPSRETFPCLHLQPAAGAFLAYIIYTSGTTGKPKGITVEHRNLLAYVEAFLQEFKITAEDTALQQASFTFDAFVEEVYPILLKGGRIAIITIAELLDIDLLLEFIARNRINITSASPLLLNELNKAGGLNKACPYLHTIISGGDVLKREYINELLKIGKTYNTYGPTETTVCVTYHECQAEGKSPVPIGKPISNYKVYILDKYSNLLPIGVPGELCVAGNGVTRGYLNRPGLTAEKFCLRRPGALFEKTAPGPHKNFLLRGPGKDHMQSCNHATMQLFPHHSPQYPITPIPHCPIYMTGDLARWLSDGTIEFIARIDNQIKIRGYRVEPGEIENQLIKHHEIKEAVVVALENELGDKYLCAYMVCNPGVKLTVSGLTDFLSRRLPAYMIPTYFMEIEQITRTPNGKIDRKALSAPEIKTEEIYVPPRNEIEEKLAEIWSGLLGIASIGIDDNFFRLGGHSLKATMLVSKVRKRLNVQIPLAELFKTPTIRELAKYIARARKSKYISINPVEKQEFYSLSSAQKRLYVVQQLDVNSTAYNLPTVISLKEEPDIEKLGDTFSKLIERHESLRTSFEVIRDQPLQRVHAPQNIDFKINFIDLTQKQSSSSTTSEEIEEIYQQPFNLNQAPLLKVGIIKHENGAYLMVVVMHHIISDGITHEILVRNFIALYRDETLPPLRIEYKDYAQWENSESQQEILKSQQSYWLKQFEGEIPLLNLPMDYKRSDRPALQGDRLAFRIKKELKGRIKQLMLETDNTLYIILLAVYNILLSLYTKQQDIIIGSPVAGRQDELLEDIVGMFVNMLPLRNQFQPTKSFREFVNDVKTNFINAFENQDYPFDKLVEILGIPRDLSRKPLVETVFTSHNTFRLTDTVYQEPQKNDSDIELYPFEFNATMFDLTLDVFEEEESILMWWTYATELFKPSAIEKFKKHYLEILEQVLENIDIILKDIKISHQLVTAETNPLQTEQGDFGF